MHYINKDKEKYIINAHIKKFSDNYKKTFSYGYRKKCLTTIKKISHNCKKNCPHIYKKLFLINIKKFSCKYKKNFLVSIKKISSKYNKKNFFLVSIKNEPRKYQAL